MSASRLREAANLLREVAEAATQGPWELVAEEVDTTTGDGGETLMRGPGNDYVVWSFAHEESAEYIATMAPPVALALADWLDATAQRIDLKGNHGWRGTKHALAIADAILADR